jgi:hypothetical protein
MTMQIEEEIVQITSSASENFSLTKDTMKMDEDMVQKQVKDIKQMELVLAKIPTKAIYK